MKGKFIVKTYSPSANVRWMIERMQGFEQLCDVLLYNVVWATLESNQLKNYLKISYVSHIFKTTFHKV